MPAPSPSSSSCCCVIPVIVLMSGGVLSAVLGFFLGRDADARYEGSELLELDD